MVRHNGFQTVACSTLVAEHRFQEKHEQLSCLDSIRNHPEIRKEGLTRVNWGILEVGWNKPSRLVVFFLGDVVG